MVLVQNQNNDGTGEVAYVELLPDEMLSYILSFLTMRDAVQTSILASRLGVENLTLQFSCNVAYSGHAGSKPAVDKYKEYYVFPCHLLSQGNESKLKQLFLQTCILGPCLNDQFRSLKTLELLDVHLVQSDVDRVFSSCLNLEFLFLEACYLPGTLHLGFLHSLKSLMVFRCFELKGIELSAAYLTTFEYTGNPINFSYLKVPSLRKLHCWADCNRSLGYIFSQLGNAHPHVEFLSIFTANNWVKQIPECLTTICKVKQLELYFYEQAEFHIPKMFAILKACPLLQKFHVVTQTTPHVKTFENFKLGGRMHKHMEEVFFGGFRGTKSEVAFVMKLVKYAVTLERMEISGKSKFSQGGRFLKSGQHFFPQVNSDRLAKILQKKAASKKAVISCCWNARMGQTY